MKNGAMNSAVCSLKISVWRQSADMTRSCWGATPGDVALNQVRAGGGLGCSVSTSWACRRMHRHLAAMSSSVSKSSIFRLFVGLAALAARWADTMQPQAASCAAR